MEREAILAAVRDAGVVGAGGAGFPTHVKLAARADVIIANGAECEPLLQVDHEILSLYLEDVLEGVEAARRAVGAQRAYLAVKAKYQSLIERLEATLASRPWLEVAPLPDIYPIGDEQRLVYELVGRLVPPRGIPIQIGVVVLNVETLYNIARALDGQPVLETFITVNGAVSEPATWAVPVGTAIEDVISRSGPLLQPGGLAVIQGGPMMGELVEDLSQPVTKTTKGLLVLPKDHLVVTRFKAEDIVLRRAFSVCSQCTMCTDLCPRHLLGHPIWPHRIMRGVAKGMTTDPGAVEEALAGALLCSECGICDSFACFMGLSPKEVNRLIKRELTFNRDSEDRLEFQGLQEVRPGFSDSQVPTERLLYRLGLVRWAQAAPFKGRLPRPRRVTIPLSQHIGRPVQCHLQIGDKVEAGTSLGDLPDGQVGALVHSSISGIVCKIEEAVVIEGEGRDG